MLDCIFQTCVHEPVQTYYFATYKRAFVDLKNPISKSIVHTNMLFYEKEIYCARLYDSTYKKYSNNCDELYSHFTSGKIGLHRDEYINKTDNTQTIALEKYPYISNMSEETDAYTYIHKKSYAYEWKGNSSVMWSKWCEYSNPENRA